MQWVRFYYNNIELSSYDLKNSYPEEMTATKELHASELGVDPSEIKVF